MSDTSTASRKLPRHSLEVLPGRRSPLFFYKAAPLDLPQDAVDRVCNAVKALVKQDGLGNGQIDIYSKRRLQAATDEPLADAFEALRAALCKSDDGQFELLVCEYARPHSDTSFAGTGFVSTVLHTGPEDYVIDAFTAKGTRQTGHEVEGATRVLAKGDTFVLDPRFAHSAMPVRPHQDCLLILAQQEIPLVERSDYLRALELFPRAPEDKDESNSLAWS